MTTDPRQAAVEALVALAAAPSSHDRADAGDALARFADRPRAQDPLVELVVDAGDTAVALRTAAALLRRHDRTGLALVGRGLARADPTRVEWIGTAVQEVLGIFATERDAALTTTRDLLRDADEPERTGLEILEELLLGLDPVLWPVVEAPPPGARRGRLTGLPAGTREQ